jgi:hypothetical protein
LRTSSGGAANKPQGAHTGEGYQGVAAPRATTAPRHRNETSTDSWITPQWLLERLGPFDLDPCVSTPQPWPTAREMIDLKSDGLLSLWHGFVWLNPPYDRSRIANWLNRMALHNNGIALLSVRTCTDAWHRYVWPFASLILFLRGRVTFHKPNGELASMGHFGSPSALIGYGPEAARRIRQCADLGAIVAVDR